jgi:ubiquinone/menaquinone biosynthesis C-methylase UbiE
LVGALVSARNLKQRNVIGCAYFGMSGPSSNIDPEVVAGFGREWSRFHQGETELLAEEREASLGAYFRIFPWDRVPKNAVAMDVGCGSGRWAMLVAPRVRHLHLVDASAEALAVARENLSRFSNVSFHLADIDDIPEPARSIDFAFSLGVLHHVPDTRKAIAAIGEKLKPGATLLLYLYYALDNRPAWNRALWKASDLARAAVSSLPPALHLPISQIVAALVYWPLARTARLFEKTGVMRINNYPLTFYRDKSFYIMRTDAYDRLCTRLEQRFTRAEIAEMLRTAGFDQVKFSENEPYWCAVAIKR